MGYRARPLSHAGRPRPGRHDGAAVRWLGCASAPATALELRYPTPPQEVVELNAFFLKYVLFLPPAHVLNIARLVFWFFLSLPATYEFYRFISRDASLTGFHRLGHNAWLALACMIAESCLVLRMLPETEFARNAHIPSRVLIMWLIAITCFIAYMATILLAGHQRTRQVLRALLVVGLVSLLAMAVTEDVGAGVVLAPGDQWEPPAVPPDAASGSSGAACVGGSDAGGVCNLTQ